MGDVVEFKPRKHCPAEVLECQCGGQRFLLLESGVVECASCGNVAPCAWEWDVEGLDI